MTTASAHIDELPILMTSTTSLAGFAELYERHYETVFRSALRVTGNPADAEDVLQTVFVRMLARAGDGEGAAQPAADFRRAAVNAAVDVLRRRELHAESPVENRALYAVQPPLLLKEQLRRAVAALDIDDASLFLLRHVEGLSIDELAGTVRNREEQRGGQAPPDQTAAASRIGTLEGIGDVRRSFGTSMATR